MTEEQRKWYLAGVNDMEAGRLVTDRVLTAEEAKAVLNAAWGEHHDPDLWDAAEAKLSLIANGGNDG